MEPSKLQKSTFPVTGMSCASCAARVSRALTDLPGVGEAVVNYAAASVQVQYDPALCPPARLRDAVVAAGYDLITDADASGRNQASEAQKRLYRELKICTLWAWLLFLPMMGLSMGVMQRPWLGYVTALLASIILFGLGQSFYRMAWRQLRHRTCNMDTLVALSTGIAYLFSLFNLLFPTFWSAQGIEPHLYFDSSAGIIAFILLGRLLEARAKQQTSVAIQKLMGLQPKTVIRQTPHGEEIIPIEFIEPGDRLLVKPGEKIPVDGAVLSGESYVDESLLSGEPMSVLKSAGAKVYAGTINQKGSLTFEAQKVGADTVLSQMIRLVQEAQGSKAPVQKLVDRVASVFVPVIILLSIATLLVWWLFAPQAGLSHGILSMVTVLIIACPCALGLATPTALMVGMGKGAEQGILIKDAESLEIARRVNVVVLDKTGTLTVGHPEVVHRQVFSDQSTALSILAAIERLSEHPLAEAIVRALPPVSGLSVGAFVSVPGQGVQAEVEGVIYRIGRKEWIEETGCRFPAETLQSAGQWMADGNTVVWMCGDGRPILVLGIADALKPTSRAAVDELHRMGIEVYMLTGDREEAARPIARLVNIKHLRGGVLPQEKSAFIRSLQEQGRIVAMVGDGINDSAALAQADLSIAMGRGSDIAVETAMVTILSSDLLKIAETIRLSRFTVRTIRQNLFWAFIYNVVAIPIAAGVLYPINGFLLNPMIGGAAMAFSSVSVVSNSLRLRRKKIGRRQNVSGSPTAVPDDAAATSRQTIVKLNHTIKMKKTLKVKGMMCGHCRAHVEQALNSLEGVCAVVTLDPPAATVECSDKEYSLAELQRVVSEQAGDYTLSE